MKIDEVTIKEAPVNSLGLAAKKVGSRVLNKLPSAAAKSKAANLAGQADLGDTANNLEKEFNAYLGTQQKTLKQATGEDLMAFLRTKNVKPKKPVPSGTLTPQILNPILLQLAKDAMAGQNAPADTSQPGASGGEPASGGADAPADKANTQQPQLDPNLKAKIDKLTPEQKKQLLSML